MSGTLRRPAWCAALIVIAAAVGTATPPARARVDPQAQATGTLDTIDVQAARRLEERRREVERYVKAVLVEPFAGSLARWRLPVCPIVAGVPREQGEFVLARLSRIIADAGAPLGPEQCQPNFYIVVTANPAALLDGWRRRDKHLFGDGSSLRVRRFLDSQQPVRVWYNAQIASGDGTPLSLDAIAGASTASQYLTNTRSKGSRLQFDDVRALDTVLVIVDAGRLGAKGIGQLADYVAMVGLAEVKPDTAGTTSPSILRLFSAAPGGEPAELSDWDKALLKALYHTPQTDRMQVRDIQNDVLRDVARAAASE